MKIFKEDNGNWSWTRVRGAITLAAAIGLAFYKPLDEWTVILILGWSGVEAVCKTWQKKMER